MKSAIYVILLIVAVLVGVVVEWTRLSSEARGLHDITYRLEGPAGCHVVVIYIGGINGIPERRQVEGILPWETTVTLRGGEAASVERVQPVGQACGVSCSIRQDGHAYLTSSESTCSRAVGWPF